jgi:hypothetical protein
MRKPNISRREQDRRACQSEAAIEHGLPQLERRWVTGPTLRKILNISAVTPRALTAVFTSIGPTSRRGSINRRSQPELCAANSAQGARQSNIHLGPCHNGSTTQTSTKNHLIHALLHTRSAARQGGAMFWHLGLVTVVPIVPSRSRLIRLLRTDLLCIHSPATH